MASRLALLATSHRVAPGLLTRAAWNVLDSADTVFAPAGHSMLAALNDAEIDVREVADTSPGECAQMLMRESSERSVVWIVGDDGDLALTDALVPLIAQAAERGQAPELEVIHGSFDVPGSRVLDLVAVMDRLRSPGGCPWDAKQTHQSLAPYLLEETYETLHALDTGDADDLREELGDLLLQVVFHARLAEEDQDRTWSIDDVAAGVVEKLVSRHPHVFAGGTAETAEDVEANWHDIKVAEKGRKTPVDGVPLNLPALALAAKLVDRRDHSGADTPIDEPELPTDLDEELLGIILLGLVAGARRHGLDAEAALRRRSLAFAEALAQHAASAAPL